MFIEQPPWFFRALYPQAIFRMDPNERAVYLTFDDGPIPEVTPWVLELLEKHNIKATFFMVGDNIKKYRDLPFQNRPIYVPYPPSSVSPALDD